MIKNWTITKLTIETNTDKAIDNNDFNVQSEIEFCNNAKPYCVPPPIINIIIPTLNNKQYNIPTHNKINYTYS